jgi:transcriptional regulator with XRE-family HTH domain
MAPMPKPNRRDLTDSERADAARLKAIYARKKAEAGLTQEKLAALMGFSTQSAVSHYLTGFIAMSSEVVFKFAHHLGVDPTEIRPDIWEKIQAQPLNGLDDEAVEFAKAMSELGPEDREYIRETLRRLTRR